MKYVVLFVVIIGIVWASLKFIGQRAITDSLEMDVSAGLEPLHWSTNFEEALSEAKISGKFMMIYFTGSDWCPPCIALNREVLSKKAFHDFAKEHLVLIKVDDPEGYTLEESVRLQNERLNVNYRVFFRYPTVVLADSEGIEVARTSYRTGGAAQYVQHLKSLLGL